MAKTVTRTYSQYVIDTIALLAGLIRSHRLEQRLSAKSVAERVGISRSMLQRIEKADPRCEVGVVFEVAALLGITLFDSNELNVKRYADETNNKLILLPKTAPKIIKRDFDDDF